MCLSILEKYDESLIYINKLLEISPNNLKALNNLAISFIKQKKYNKAIEEFNKILKIKPNDGNILYRCAETHYNVSEYKKSIELYKKTINLFEKSSTEKHYIKRSFNTIFFAYCYQGFGNDYFSTLNEFSNSITNFKLPKLTALKKNNNKINVGFVTADFRNHPVASYFVDFFKLLNKKKFLHIFSIIMTSMIF
jgi:tetratricopeptide (TPR) repeat protein